MMGYRSEVHFTIVGPRDKMMAHLVTYRLQTPNADAVLSDCRFFNKGDQLVIKFCGYDLKWYRGYEDVKNLTALFEMFRELNDEAGGQTYHGAFVRIGEEDDDNETEYFSDEGYDLERICRSVDSSYLFDEGVKLEDLRNKPCNTNADSTSPTATNAATSLK